MYCDDSRVTQVDPKEVVVSPPYYYLLLPKLTSHSTRGSPLTSYTIRESKSKLYITYSCSYSHLHFLLHSSTPATLLCIIFCNYTNYA